MDWERKGGKRLSILCDKIRGGKGEYFYALNYVFI
jgi:hypothetical protein